MLSLYLAMETSNPAYKPLYNYLFRAHTAYICHENFRFISFPAKSFGNSSPVFQLRQVGIFREPWLKVC